MPLFFLSKKNIHDTIAHFSSEESRHIRKVYRLKRGDQVMAFDEDGDRYLVTLVDETSRQVIGQIKERIKGGEGIQNISIQLGVGIPKGDRLDTILQKSTELGVSEIVPFISSRTVARIPLEKRQDRVFRWQRIVRESVKQCGAPFIPKVRDILSFQDALSRHFSSSLKILLYEETFDFTLKKILTGKGPVTQLSLLVGPEGGFSHREVELAEKHGFTPAGLGKNVLRVETAAIAALAMIHYHFATL